jgi:NAD(P)-dependent dehydrogenase (short-subunit alcohol dehydrogenase family)
MTGPFGATSTTDDVLEGVDLSGKRVLVTGASAGLGVETARALVAHGAQVVGAVRDLDKAHRATEPVRGAAANGGGAVEFVTLDLASLASVRACADTLLAAGKPFDLIIANAGIMACPQSRTADGFEMQFGTNHLGHFVLINRIALLLKSGGRLVNLSSAGHRFSDVNIEDPNFEHTPYSEFGAYGRSKTANILFAVEFDRRHKADGARATAVHPGVIQTELGRHMTPEVIRQIIPDDGSAPTFTWKTFRRAPPPRSGAASSPRPNSWAAYIARTATSLNCRTIPKSAGASAPTPSTRIAPRRFGPRARRWSARRSDEARLDALPPSGRRAFARRGIESIETTTTARKSARQKGLKKGWWTRLGSNQRPLRCQRSALPLSYASACRCASRRRGAGYTGARAPAQARRG